MKIYLAGPLFSTAERDFNARLAGLLREMELIRTLVPRECGYAYRKKPIILFRTDFRVGYEIRGDVHPVEEHARAPYNLMLTESADVRLDLPFKLVEDIAVSIEKALTNLSLPVSNAPKG